MPRRNVQDNRKGAAADGRSTSGNRSVNYVSPKKKVMPKTVVARKGTR